MFLRYSWVGNDFLGQQVSGDSDVTRALSLNCGFLPLSYKNVRSLVSEDKDEKDKSDDRRLGMPCKGYATLVALMVVPGRLMALKS